MPHRAFYVLTITKSRTVHLDAFDEVDRSDGPQKRIMDASGEGGRWIGPPGGDVYPVHEPDNSPLWSEDQEEINQTGDIYPVVWPLAGSRVPGDPEPADGFSEVNPIFERHQPPLRKKVRLLFRMRENTLIWRHVPKYH